MRIAEYLGWKRAGRAGKSRCNTTTSSEDKDKKHREEIQKRVDSGLLPCIKRKGVLINCLSKENIFLTSELMDRTSHINLNDKVKWLIPKMLEQANLNLIEAKKLKKEYSEEETQLRKEFKARQKELKIKYGNRISRSEKIVKRIVKKGHPYIL